ncbi:hypothetical protein Scep_020233 [Stephania cephalantha]|uniref:F-box domain-containing protein n=1 Tax=Stephania cephalantha TaxID=152367 RepID=A0AAP0ICA0_9MAGN
MSMVVKIEIGEDIVFQEILPRLPIKSIFRFKLVYKKWLNLFTRDPLFSTHHSQKCLERSNNITYFSHKCNRFITEDDHFMNWSEPTFTEVPYYHNRVLGSVNGLVYGSCYKHSEIYVCNPITKHTVFVPKLRRAALECWLSLGPMHGIPTLASHLLGLGVIIMTNIMIGRMVMSVLYVSKCTRPRRASSGGDLKMLQSICFPTLDAINGILMDRVGELLKGEERPAPYIG